MRPEAKNNSALDRICDILNVFSEENRLLTLTQISREINLPKSTTHRILAGLVDKGLIYKEPDGHRFRLGYQLILWGTLAQQSIDLRNVALPILKELSSITGETVVLSTRDGNFGIWIEQIEGDHAIRLARRVGIRLRLHAGASSKVLWAFLPENEIEKILTQIDLVQLQSNTITDKERMMEELHSIRQRGYSTSFEETDPGAMGVAAPVYDHNGYPVAGIGIVAPNTRVTKKQIPGLAKLVMEAGQELSILLGAPIRNSIDVEGKEINVSTRNQV
jgi:DNA-binding IclR family transcriptional regulator